MYQGIALDIATVMPQAVATGLFVSLCTVQAPDGIVSAGGVPSGTYANITGLISIPCMDAPQSVGSIVATEAKAAAEIESRRLRHILLNGYYSQLDGLNWGSVGWRAVVDTITYDLLGAERDSKSSQTRLRLQLVSV